MKPLSFTPLVRPFGALLALALASSATAQSFFAIPGMNYAGFVSDDGAVVAGGLPSYDYAAARWTQSTGTLSLGTFPGADVFPRNAVTGMSADGSVIVGNVHSGVGAFGDRMDAFRYTAGTGMVGLGHLPGDHSSEAAAVSADGNIVVGSSTTPFVPGMPFNTEATRWTQSTGVVGLGSLGSGFSSDGEATGISADGSIVVGLSEGQAFRWTEGAGMQGLGFIATQVKLSGDGNVIAGWDFTGEPFRWTADLGLVPLGSPELTANNGGTITSLTGDGSIILGASWDLHNRPYSFIWSETSGLRDFRTILEDVFGLGTELAGWGNLIGQDISADGRYIVGSGTNPLGEAQGWLIDLGEKRPPLPPGHDVPPPVFHPVPEPATYGWIAAVGLGALIFIRRQTGFVRRRTAFVR